MTDKKNNIKKITVNNGKKLTVNNGEKNKDKTKDEDELDDEMKQRVKEIEALIEETNRPSKTSLLKNLKFENEQDAHVFSRLPLSDYQKEELLMSVYATK